MARTPKPHRLTLSKKQLIDYAEDLEGQIATEEKRTTSLMIENQRLRSCAAEYRNERDLEASTAKYWRTLSAVRGDSLQRKDAQLRAMQEDRAVEQRLGSPLNVGACEAKQAE